MDFVSENGAGAPLQENGTAPQVLNVKKLRKRNRKKGFLVVKIVMFIVFALYAASLLYALLFALSISFKDQWKYPGENQTGFPDPWVWTNYTDAWEGLGTSGSGMLGMFINSIWYAVGGSLLGVVVSAMMAYVVAKYKFPGRNILYAVAIFTMMLPIVGAFPSQYRVYETLGINNSPFLLLTKASGFGFNFVVLYSFFKSLPWSYAEAAMIDGAGHFRSFIQVMMPQAVGVIMALFLVAFIQQWNDYMFPILFLKDWPTLSSGLYIYQIKQVRETNYPVLFAGLILSVIPVLALYIVFQNTLMDMTMSGGLKG